MLLVLKQPQPLSQMHPPSYGTVEGLGQEAGVLLPSGSALLTCTAQETHVPGKVYLSASVSLNTSTYLWNQCYLIMWRWNTNVLSDDNNVLYF